jgi:hypothetical protein
VPLFSLARNFMSDQLPPSPALPAAPATPRRAFSGWPVAAVLITLLLIVGLPFAYLAVSSFERFTTAPSRIASAFSKAAGEAARPHLTINEIVVDSIQDLHKQSKLVVFDTTLNTDVTRQEGASSWGVYWGSNVARVAVRDAHVSYVIDLSQLGTSNFQYNSQEKVLTVFLPKPRIDPQLVSIDPAKIQTLDLRGGWARWDKYQTRENAIAELKPKLITQAQAPFVQKLAREAGVEATTTLLQPLADNLAQEGATVKVVYTE